MIRKKLTNSRGQVPARTLGTQHYDRGECSAFVPWDQALTPGEPSFIRLLGRKLDQALNRRTLPNPGLPCVGDATVNLLGGNAVFTPLLALAGEDTVYKEDVATGTTADTPDTFRFTRPLQVTCPSVLVGVPLTSFCSLQFEGGFRTRLDPARGLSDGEVRFKLSNLVVNCSNSAADGRFSIDLTNSATAGEVEAALTDALWEQLYVVPPLNGHPFELPCRGDTQAEKDEVCYTRLASVLRDRASVNLLHSQFKCRTNRSGSNFPEVCKVGPGVDRTQEYPDDFELVLSHDAMADQDYRCLSVDDQQFTQRCVFPWSPIRFTQNASGIVNSTFFRTVKT